MCRGQKTLESHFLTGPRQSEEGFNKRHHKVYDPATEECGKEEGHACRVYITLLNDPPFSAARGRAAIHLLHSASLLLKVC